MGDHKLNCIELVMMCNLIAAGCAAFFIEISPQRWPPEPLWVGLGYSIVFLVAMLISRGPSEIDRKDAEKFRRRFFISGLIILCDGGAALLLLAQGEHKPGAELIQNFLGMITSIIGGGLLMVALQYRVRDR